jgi:hypothetical protein
MTESEALGEAIRRWGPRGYVRIRADESTLCTVGLLSADMYWVKGTGQTWEGAFEQADRNVSVEPDTEARLQELKKSLDRLTKQAESLAQDIKRLKDEIQQLDPPKSSGGAKDKPRNERMTGAEKPHLR